MTAYELWEHVFPPEKRWLGFLCALSALVHAGGFFVIEVTAPKPGFAPSRPPAVVLVGVDSSAARLGQVNSGLWLDWLNPSAVSLPSASLPPLPALVGSVNQPLSTELPPMPPSADRELWTALRSAPPDPTVTAKEFMNHQRPAPAAVVVEAPPKLSGTVVLFQGALEKRQIVKRVEMPRPATRLTLQSSEYFLQVTPGGVVIDVRVDRSSGESSIDRQGSEVLRQWRFAPADESVWGRAVVFWDFQEESTDRVEFQF